MLPRTSILLTIMASSAFVCFLDLPAEVRYMIHRELLCSFTFEDNALVRILRQSGTNTDLNQTIRPIHVSILQINHEIH
jgi:hypothetical protein